MPLRWAVGRPAARRRLARACWVTRRGAGSDGAACAGSGLLLEVTVADPRSTRCRRLRLAGREEVGCATTEVRTALQFAALCVAVRRAAVASATVRRPEGLRKPDESFMRAAARDLESCPLVSPKMALFCCRTILLAGLLPDSVPRCRVLAGDPLTMPAMSLEQDAGLLGDGRRFGTRVGDNSGSSAARAVGRDALRAKEREQQLH